MYTDHHVHFLATAAARLSIDVSGARSITEVMERLRGRPGTGWLRAWGYDESELADGRHPTRWDLDRADISAPVVLHHRTGHAAVLSSAALREVGEDGHPDGLLVDRHDLLSRVPRLDPARLEAAAGQVSRDWAGAGVDAFVDATHTNGRAELELLASWCRRGVLSQSVTAMVAPGQTAGVPPYGERLGPVQVGPVKLMRPPLAGPIAAAHAAGFPVAVHVVDIDVLEEALAAMESSPPPAGTMDRIEHNALCLPEHVQRMATRRGQLQVVVNPSFLVHRRAKYEAQLSPLERSWLIRMRSLVDAGVDVRAGSDSPVTPAAPAEMISAAMSHPFVREESLDRAGAEALLRR